VEDFLRYRSLEEFCRQRARIEEKDSGVWLEKAGIFAGLAAAESRSKIAETSDEEESLRRRLS
jgi:hypothetical protein